MTTKREYEERFRMFERLKALGITTDHCEQLRRISMTLRAWFTLECGDSNDHASWGIERDGDEDDSPPYMVRHIHTRDASKPIRTKIADRENGAKKRLAAIMANYPTLTAYIQGDCRGAALHILKPGDIPADGTADQYYNRGIAVY